jgi:hypothetical protein
MTPVSLGFNRDPRQIAHARERKVTQSGERRNDIKISIFILEYHQAIRCLLQPLEALPLA